MEDDVDQLYTLAPEDFIAARDALAKARPVTDRIRIKALRKPTVGSWLVNQLVRTHRELVEGLLTVGLELRRAQQAGRADVMRSLGADRRALTDELVTLAADLAGESGRAPTADLLAAVASSLDAAVADSALAEQLRRATLTEPLSYAGFGAFGLTTVPDLAPAPVTTARRTKDHKTDTTPPRTGPTSRERAAAERERAAAERKAATHQRRVEEATAALSSAHEQRRAAEELLRLTEHALSDAKMGLDLARRAEQKAQAALAETSPGPS